MDILGEEFRLLVECFSYTSRRAEVAFDSARREEPFHRNLAALFAFRFAFLFFTWS